VGKNESEEIGKDGKKKRRRKRKVQEKIE